jgi:hypothetical protein
MEIKTPVIPVKTIFYNNKSNHLYNGPSNFKDEELDLKSIAFFAATGFFYNDTTFYENVRTLPPASKISVDENNIIKGISRYWDWHYSPEIYNIEEATSAFANIFESYIEKNIKDEKIILPLSGGIDSRTIAAAIPYGLDKIVAYSYKFEGGIDEVEFGRSIAKAKGLDFKDFQISKGYLWNHLKELTDVTHCYSEFTHSRQLAVISELEKLGNLFLLGHGGELFRASKVDKNLNFDQLVDFIIKGSLKCGGLELAEHLWKVWGLTGTFSKYLKNLVSEALDQVKIKENRGRLRAFYYKFFVVPQSTINIKIFNRNNKILLPFWQEDMLELVCRIHEDLLTDRKLQINYIKKKSPELAAIPWQDYYPYNLFDYQKCKKNVRVPVRVYNYLTRAFQEKVFQKKIVKRNWELQFLGEDNDIQLRNHLFDDKRDSNLIEIKTKEHFYKKFKYDNPKYYSHSISILLTLSYFERI